MFSCIIPIYNSSHIDLQFQNLNDLVFSEQKSIEYIFVNDGSNDTLLLELEKKTSSDTRFSLISLPDFKVKCNRVTQARNLWAFHARWEVLIFIDQDTLVSQKYIDVLTSMTLSENQIILGPYYGYNNYKKLLSQREVDLYLSSWSIPWKEYQDFRIEYPGIFQQDQIWKYFCASNFIMRRDDFLKSTWFDENIISWWDEDVELWYRLSKNHTISFNSELGVLNLSSKLYQEPYNILEQENISSLFDNILRNFQKHQTKEYLSYLLERYNWLNAFQKKYISSNFNSFIQWIKDKKIY